MLASRDRSFVLALVGGLLILLASPAYAYLDPAAGSLILQVVLGGIAGFLVMAKLLWRRVLGFIGVRRRAAGSE